MPRANSLMSCRCALRREKPIITGLLSPRQPTRQPSPRQHTRPQTDQAAAARDWGVRLHIGRLADAFIKGDLPTLSMHNRIETIKIIILPWLFLFQSLPVQIPTKQFTEWMISRFVWQSKKPRVGFKTLQLSKEKGGMSLSSLEDYYKGSTITIISLLVDQWLWSEMERTRNKPTWYPTSIPARWYKV